MSQNAIPQATSSLPMWLDYLSSIHNSSIDLGLERVQAVAQKASLSKPAPTIITVAGTNGKGSTCAILESILLAAGYTVGVYSSPHLISYNERVRINGEILADEKHTYAFDFIEKQRGATSLSFFEFGTLAAFRLLQEEGVDVAILEVGLGGRLDATNVVEHDVSVITSLAIDHVDWLGSDLAQIGYEKAGIFRAGRPAVCGEPHPPATVAAYADEIGAELFQVGIQFDYQVADDVWHWSHGAFDLRDLPKPQLPLPNAATALMALGCAGLEISDVDIVEGLEKASLPGRMQQLSDQPVILLDVAHNPHSAHYLTSQIELRFPGKKIHLVIGMLHDKDIQETIAALAPVIHHWYPASLDGPRAALASELHSHIPVPSQTYESPVNAFKAAMTRADENDVIIVAGSFLTVGEVLDFWNKRGV
ncbi:bifunctional tetrahydrofolate synthase/dihydrofolate synthase [Vibrio mangrovi]|uniref:Dihydrofolate synthase/folylpolyglutamate synthase n=1 Tax=Vibrio mangrovi TaxID=474394 RepID=A0A1Y6IRV0_9VIBR|nr:bifunctional tetrahydrofolate synthase/dihydrofolate synthase [Vibrio mangrovi]MDW6003448.1 bifunctional tetrahydrofolate synthase/dihydrofolate synthase [Vibrio mangrovi]SMR99761.1 Bifunctional protein FolC [Vibrio mangrovi]